MNDIVFQLRFNEVSFFNYKSPFWKCNMDVNKQLLINKEQEVVEEQQQ